MNHPWSINVSKPIRYWYHSFTPLISPNFSLPSLVHNSIHLSHCHHNPFSIAWLSLLELYNCFQVILAILYKGSLKYVTLWPYNPLLSWSQWVSYYHPLYHVGLWQLCYTFLLVDLPLWFHHIDSRGFI